MHIHMAGITPSPQAALSSYRAIDADAPEATTSGGQAARLPTLSAIDNRNNAPSAPEREPPPYHEAIRGTDRIDLQAPITDLPCYVGDRRAFMTANDHLIGQWEGRKWQETSEAITGFLEEPLVQECGFSAAEAEPALRAMATWMEMARLNPHPSFGSDYPDKVDSNNLAMRSLAEFNICVKNHADQLDAYAPACKTMFTDLAKKIDGFLLDVAPVQRAEDINVGAASF